MYNGLGWKPKKYLPRIKSIPVSPSAKWSYGSCSHPADDQTRRIIKITSVTVPWWCYLMYLINSWFICRDKMERNRQAWICGREIIERGQITEHCDGQSPIIFVHVFLGPDHSLERALAVACNSHLSTCVWWCRARRGNSTGRRDLAVSPGGQLWMVLKKSQRMCCLEQRLSHWREKELVLKNRGEDLE